MRLGGLHGSIHLSNAWQERRRAYERKYFFVLLSQQNIFVTCNFMIQLETSFPLFLLCSPTETSSDETFLSINAAKDKFSFLKLFEMKNSGELWADLSLFSRHSEKMIIKYIFDCSRFKRIKSSMFQEFSLERSLDQHSSSREKIIEIKPSFTQSGFFRKRDVYLDIQNLNLL